MHLRSRIRRIASASAAAALLAWAAACSDSPAPTDTGVMPILASNKNAVKTVKVSPSSATIPVDGTVQLTATAYGTGNRQITGATFTWSSSASGVATVDASGLVTGVAPGTAVITATSGGKSGSSTITVVGTPPPPSGDPVLVGAGDIASCSSSGDEATAALLDAIAGTVITLGDNAYPNGSATDYANCYDPTWGRQKARTRPAVGNHEYQTVGATGYYNYFGAAAGDPTAGYYSYDVGAWHIIVLNSNCAIVLCAAGSPQEQWLRAELAAHPAQCTLAYWHHPRFNSGSAHGNNTAVGPFWDALYAAGAEIVLNGHEHIYERFAPQTPAAAADPATGIREFIVGTGGVGHYSIGTVQPNSEVRDVTSFGVLKLTLSASSYAWEFVPVAGASFHDSGTGTCH